MARPPKNQRVDYFPHMCLHGKTMFVIEQKYGNDGYAFWFKLLEQLGAKDGHALDVNDAETFEYMQARTHLSAERCIEILTHLAKLHAIDNDLWQNNRIIWSQNFADNLSDVYRKRKSETPQKPSFRAGNPPKPEQSGVSVTETRQRIGEDRIGEDRTAANVSGAETQEQVQHPPHPSSHFQGEGTSTQTIGCQEQHTLELIKQHYPPAGLQVGIEDGQVDEILSNEIPVSEHGPLITAVKNYAEQVRAEGTEPRYVRRIVNFLRDGFWRNYARPQPLGRDGPPQEDPRAWKQESDAMKQGERAKPPKERPAFMKGVEVRAI